MRIPVEVASWSRGFHGLYDTKTHVFCRPYKSKPRFRHDFPAVAQPVPVKCATIPVWNRVLRSHPVSSAQQLRTEPRLSTESRGNMNGSDGITGLLRSVCRDSGAPEMQKQQLR